MQSRAGTMMCGVLLVLFLSTPAVLFAEGAAKVQEVRKEMSLTQAVILGAIEGLTEYLPVSSTGHLLVAEHLMGLGKAGSASPEEAQQSKDAADAYAICIQAGAIAAVFWLYFGRIRQMGQGIFGRDKEGLRMVVNLIAAFVPAAVIGLLLNKTIKAHLFGMWPVIAAWFAGGLVILAVPHPKEENREQPNAKKSLDQLRVRMALVIGLVQCIAMWPGVSRSLVTILGGASVGLSLSAAVEFSFLLGLLTLGAATCYDAIEHGHVMLQTYDGLSLLVGLIAAFIFAVFSMKWMVAYLNRHGLSIFGYYRIMAAIVAIVLLF